MKLWSCSLRTSRPALKPAGHLFAYAAGSITPAMGIDQTAKLSMPVRNQKESGG